MLPIIFSYLAGIIVEVNFQTDYYFLVFVFLLTSLSVSIYFVYKGHIKDTQKVFYMSFILLSMLAFFVLGAVYSRITKEEVSYRYLPQNLYGIEGKIVDMKQNQGTKTLALQVNKFQNL
jgi:VIT1/CCC1 family predicted Fe2+/Mn2+ transporter